MPVPSTLWIKLLKQAEHPVAMARVNANAIVAHKKHRVRTPPFHARLDERLGLVPHELARVLHQILPDFHQARPVAFQFHSGPATRTSAPLVLMRPATSPMASRATCWAMTRAGGSHFAAHARQIQ